MEMEAYQYEPVDEASHEIRLFILLPGAFTDPICGLLNTVELLPRKHEKASTSSPRYEALSYAWGSPVNPSTIHVRTATRDRLSAVREGSSSLTDKGSRRQRILDPMLSQLRAINTLCQNRFSSSAHKRITTSDFSPLKVTQNLAEALPYLRLTDRARVFWIDAICVNQEDRQERSRQVQRMADVYSLAGSVIAWLGEAGQGRRTPIALDLINRIYSEVQYDSQSVNLIPAKESCTPPHNDENAVAEIYNEWTDFRQRVRLNHDELEGLEDLLSRDWFTRLWVCQEIQLARPYQAVAVCGHHQIPWAVFSNAIAVIHYKKIGLVSGAEVSPKAQDEEDNATVDHIMGLISEMEYLVEPLLLGGRYRLYHLAQMTRKAQCSDERDRVYALLSLTDNDGYGIVPDYTQSPRQIFRNVAEQIITVDQSLDLLRYANFHPGRLDLPSWVPDCSRLGYDFLSAAVAFHPNHQSRHFALANDIISAQGVTIATISHVSSGISPDTSFPQNIVDFIVTACSDLGLDLDAKYTQGAGTMREALTCTLVGHQFAEDYHPPYKGLPSRMHLQSYMSLLSRIVVDGHFSTELAGQDNFYMSLVQDTLRNNALYLTSEGYVGISPVHARPGDQVVNLLGCSYPVLLRPTTDGTCKVVGTTYCHGFMRGEAFLGPLPDNVSLVWSSATSLPIYVNSTTHKTFPEDPRFRELPSGWSRVEHSRSQEYTIFREDATGMRFCSHSFDPRLSPDILKARGVNVQEFRLS